MAELTDAQIDAALARGHAARAQEPRASSARYDRQLRRIIVELTNGCTFAFPPHLAQSLEAATEDQLAQVELLGTRLRAALGGAGYRFFYSGFACRTIRHPYLYGTSRGPGEVTRQSGPLHGRMAQRAAGPRKTSLG